MKRVLMLGGSVFQVPSIITAKKMGLYVITCDYLPENPGHKFADEYYNVSTTDLDAVLELARKLKIDGIVCYASDPSAPTAAYVAEKLGLPGNPYKSVNILANKDLFRAFLTENNFNVPRAKGYSCLQSALDEFEQYKMPVMVKPVDSCGSKGVSKICSKEQLKKAAENALLYSRNKRFLIEEYIEKNGYQIAGDGFSVDGNLVFRCFANEHFETGGVNPFVPIGESWPYIMPQKIHDKIHNEIQRALTLLGMKTGAYNFDIRIDDNENVYLMEIGPRNGGNLIPQVTRYATGVDMVRYTISAALGEDCSSLKMEPVNGFWSCYMIHSSRSGTFRGITIEPELKEKNIVELEILPKPGEHVSAFTGGNGTFGTMILKYSSQDEMLEKMDHMERWLKVVLCEQQAPCLSGKQFSL